MANDKFVDPDDQLGQANFVDPDDVAKEQQVKQQEAVKAEQPQSIGQKVMQAAGTLEGGKLAVGEGAMQGLTQAVAGVGQIATVVAEKIGLAKPGTEAAYTQKASDLMKKQAKSAPQALNEFPLEKGAGKIAGNVTPMLAIPGSIGGTVAKQLASGAAIGAGTGAIQFYEPDQSRALGTVLGGLMGTIPGITSAAKRVLSSAKSIPKILAQRTFFKSPLENAASGSIDDAATNLKVNLTRGERLNDPNLMADEARIKLNQPNRELVTSAIGARDATINKALQENIKSIGKGNIENLRTAADEAYNTVKDTALDANTVATLRQDPNINRIYQQTLGPNRTSNVGADTVDQFDKIKKILDYDIATAQTAAGGKGSSAAQNVVNDLTNSKKLLTQKLDQAVPGYATARQLAQPVKIFDKYQDKLSNIATKEGETAPLDKVYTTFFEKPAQRARYLEDIKAGGGNVEQARDIMTIMGRINKSPINRLIGKQVEGTSELAVAAGGPSGMITQYGTRLLGGQYNKELLKLTLDPTYAKEVAAIRSLKSVVQQANKLGTLAVKVASSQVLGSGVKTQDSSEASIKSQQEEISTAHSQGQAIINSPVGGLERAIRDKL